MEENGKIRRAYFAAGCFWCITPFFAEKEGVISVTAGYCGGDEADPTYEEVKHQLTHHRETVCVEYDPEKVDYAALVYIFLNNVDPFDGEGQFIDRGRSYTLAVYWEREEERSLAEDALARLEVKSGKPCAVSVEAYKMFYRAEEYHQDYYRKNPEAFEKELIESGRKVSVVPLN